MQKRLPNAEAALDDDGNMLGGAVAGLGALDVDSEGDDDDGAAAAGGGGDDDDNDDDDSDEDEEEEAPRAAPAAGRGRGRARRRPRRRARARAWAGAAMMSQKFQFALAAHTHSDGAVPPKVMRQTNGTRYERGARGPGAVGSARPPPTGHFFPRERLLCEGGDGSDLLEDELLNLLHLRDLRRVGSASRGTCLERLRRRAAVGVGRRRQRRRAVGGARRAVGFVPTVGSVTTTS